MSSSVPYDMPILDVVLSRIMSLKRLEDLRISEIFLAPIEGGCPHNVIKLNDSSIGTSMCYHEFKSEEERSRIHRQLIARINSDPLLLGHLSEQPPDDLLMTSLKSGILSALSMNLIARKNNAFTCSSQMNYRIPQGSISAVVIGFGGLLIKFLEDPIIERIHISDLAYSELPDSKAGRYFRDRIEDLRNVFTNKCITISDGKDTRERIETSDVVSITGSALCNGTMDEILYYSRRCKAIIVQGQSAGIYPEPLFERGVSLVMTTLKPPNFLEIAKVDFIRFRELLEGGLPWLYITPKK